MLILERKDGERLTIGPDITIYIRRTVFGKVWLGIEAPADMRIVRDDAKVKTPKPHGEWRQVNE